MCEVTCHVSTLLIGQLVSRPSCTVALVFELFQVYLVINTTANIKYGLKVVFGE